MPACLLKIDLQKCLSYKIYWWCKGRNYFCNHFNTSIIMSTSDNKSAFSCVNNHFTLKKFFKCLRRKNSLISTSLLLWKISPKTDLIYQILLKEDIPEIFQNKNGCIFPVAKHNFNERTQKNGNNTAAMYMGNKKALDLGDIWVAHILYFTLQR